MKQSSLGVIGAFLFLLVSAGIFYYLYNSSVNSVSIAPNTAAFQPVNITGLKDQVVKLSSGAENNAGLPIPVPLSKLGKSNPFNNPE